MKRKGVSPVIATVLLVAMVVIIAVIVFLWFKTMSQEAITKFEGENVELVCAKVDFRAEYDNTLNKIYISNNGNVPIYKMKVQIIQEGSHKTSDFDELIVASAEDWPAMGIGQGGSLSREIDIDSGVQKLILVPELLGESDSGKKSHLCNAEQYGVEVLIP